MKKILYLYNARTSFVAIDEGILSQRYQLQSVLIQRRHPGLFYEMWRKTRDIDAVVAWFASWHSLPAFTIATLRKIPRILITGGYDVANEPEIDYGLRQGGITKLISGVVFRSTTRALPFSEYSYREALTNTPLTENKMTMILLGAPDVPEFATAIAKERLVMTVGNIDHLTIHRKGIKLFVEAARHLPDVPFYVVGKARDESVEELKQIASPNVQFTGFMDDAALIQLRQRAKVYVQASRHEGFGLALAESMLARCVPVVSRYGALPEVVGDTGIYIDSLSPEAVAASIGNALGADEQAGEKARQHILTQYPLEKRQQLLYAELDALLN